MNYVKSNLSKGRRLNQVVTKITLKRATNLSGIAFSQAVFTFDRVLTDEERAAVGHVTEAAQMYAEKLNPAAMAEFHDDLPADSDTERPVPLR